MGQSIQDKDTIMKDEAGNSQNINQDRYTHTVLKYFTKKHIVPRLFKDPTQPLQEPCSHSPPSQ